MQEILKKENLEERKKKGTSSKVVGFEKRRLEEKASIFLQGIKRGESKLLFAERGKKKKG